MRSTIMAILLLAACGAPAPEAAPVALEVAPRILLPLELLEPGAAAVGLWQRAGYDAPAAALADEAGPGDIRVLAHEGLIEGCAENGELSWGCTERVVGMTTYVWLSDQVPVDMVVSVLAHEFGHAALALEHTADGIMYPERSAAERRHPCVDDVCLN